MAIELTASRSRRAILAAAGGALAALAAQALGRPLSTRAADGQAVLVGGEYTSTSRTKITNSGNYDSTIQGASTGAGGIGLLGSSNSGPGVWGSSDSDIGVFARSYASDRAAVVARADGGNTGLVGFTGGPLPTTPAKTGVYGYAVQDSGSRGVWGRANAGRGVYGQASSGLGVRGYATTGKAISGEATTGIALHAKGRVQLEQSSGTATFAAGTRSKKVSPGLELTSATKVLVTLMGNPGGSTVVQRVAVDTIANSFTVYLTASAANTTKFAWLVLV